MSGIAKSKELAQLRTSEEFCREIIKLGLPARLYAMKMIKDSVGNLSAENHDTQIALSPIPHLTDLRGLGNNNWGSKEEVDAFIREERESWD